MPQTSLAASRYSSLTMRKKALESLLKRNLSAEQKSANEAKLAAINTRLASPGQKKEGEAATAKATADTTANEAKMKDERAGEGVLQQRFGDNWRRKVYGPDFESGKIAAGYKLSQEQRASSEHLSSLKRELRHTGTATTDADLRGRLEKKIAALVAKRSGRAEQVAAARKFVQGTRKARSGALAKMPGEWLIPGAKVPPEKRRRKNR